MAKKVAIGNICSLMFFACFYNVFYKSKKHVFMFFYLQINVFNIYDVYRTVDWA